MKKLILISIMMFLVLAIAVSADNRLKITEITAELDGNDDSVSLSNPKLDIEPESELKVKITVENDFADSDDIQIENIEIKAYLRDIDGGSDIKLTSSEFDLDPGDDKTITFDFDIPLRLDDDKYDLDIEAEGKDENKTKQSDKIMIEINVDKKTHDLRFFKKEFTSGTLICERQTTLLLGLINLGKDEEDATITVRNQRLGIDFEDKARLDEKPSNDDNTFEKEYIINVPEAIQGTYMIELKAEFGSSSSETEEVPLYIQQCVDRRETTDTSDEDINDDSEVSGSQSTELPSISTLPGTTDTTINQPNTQESAQSQAKFTTFDGSVAIIVLEIIAIVVGILLIIVLNRK